jgi:hypothetical protein
MPTPASIIAAVVNAGATWNGIQRFKGREDYAVFTDPETQSTMMLPFSEVTAEAVSAAIARKRAEYAA